MTQKRIKSGSLKNPKELSNAFAPTICPIKMPLMVMIESNAANFLSPGELYWVSNN